jgi:hypothetical protein
MNVRDIQVRPEVLYVRREEDAPEETPGVFSEFDIVIAYCFPSTQPCDQDEVIFRLRCIWPSGLGAMTSPLSPNSGIRGFGS